MAGRQGQILREKLMPELAEFAKQSLVQGLYAQRNALIETQQVAQQALVELETRLAKLQLSLPERIRAYEKRIGELEKEVESQGEEMRELTRATLVLVRKKLEDERERQRERPGASVTLVFAAISQGAGAGGNPASNYWEWATSDPGGVNVGCTVQIIIVSAYQSGSSYTLSAQNIPFQSVFIS